MSTDSECNCSTPESTASITYTTPSDAKEDPLLCPHILLFFLVSGASFAVGVLSTLLVRFVLFVRRLVRDRSRERRLRLLLRTHPVLDAAYSSSSSSSRALSRLTSSSPLLSLSPTNSSAFSSARGPHVLFNEHIEHDAFQLQRHQSRSPHVGLHVELDVETVCARLPSTLRRRRAASPTGEAVLEAAPGLPIDPPESPLVNALRQWLVFTQVFCARLEASMLYVCCETFSQVA